MPTSPEWIYLKHLSTFRCFNYIFARREDRKLPEANTKPMRNSCSRSSPDTASASLLSHGSVNTLKLIPLKVSLGQSETIRLRVSPSTWCYPIWKRSVLIGLKHVVGVGGLLMCRQRRVRRILRSEPSARDLKMSAGDNLSWARLNGGTRQSIPIARQ